MTRKILYYQFKNLGITIYRYFYRTKGIGFNEKEHYSKWLRDKIKIFYTGNSIMEEWTLEKLDDYIDNCISSSNKIIVDETCRLVETCIKLFK
jgi:hypothetical protein